MKMSREVEKIEDILKIHPRGLTISKIARKLGLDRNTVSRYLSVMLAEGRVEMWEVGSAKVYILSSRVPLHL
jgi:DNA-binding IclR family transcriptional regulator